MFIPKSIVEDKLKALLAEDIGQGDVTAAIIPADLKVDAEVIAKEAGVVAGIEEATLLAQSLGLKVTKQLADGSPVKTKQILMVLSGNAQTILTVERTLLNLLSRMSGIATKTSLIAEKLQSAGVKTRIAATRKTAPGLMYFDKKAVMIGGGDPHRLHLDDMLLIKDNHLVIFGSVELAVKAAKAKASFTKKIEVEVTSVDNALKAAEAGADIVMLDNFKPQDAKSACDTLRKAGFGNVMVELSGGLTDDNLMQYAGANVDVISMGALTHSVKALDISLEIKKL